MGLQQQVQQLEAGGRATAAAAAVAPTAERKRTAAAAPYDADADDDQDAHQDADDSDYDDAQERGIAKKQKAAAAAAGPRKKRQKKQATAATLTAARPTAPQTRTPPQPRRPRAPCAACRAQSRRRWCTRRALSVSGVWPCWRASTCVPVQCCACVPRRALTAAATTIIHHGVRAQAARAAWRWSCPASRRPWWRPCWGRSCWPRPRAAGSSCRCVWCARAAVCARGCCLRGWPPPAPHRAPWCVMWAARARPACLCATQTHATGQGVR
jgi:hypothetical protein